MDRRGVTDKMSYKYHQKKTKGDSEITAYFIRQRISILDKC